MAKKIKQIRDPEQNCELLDNIYAVSLGIHALPGTTFKINQIDFEASTIPLIIGPTGNFSIECEEYPITSMKLIEIVNDSYPIIIDIIYEEGNII